MSSRTVVIVAVVSSIIALIVWLLRAPPPPAPAPSQPAPSGSLFLVFVDVTSRLEPSEIDAVGESVGQMVWPAPEGSRLIVLPILRDVERGQPLLDKFVPQATTSTEMASVQAWRRDREKELQQAVRKLVPVVNSDPAQERSCVSEAFRRAEEIIRAESKNNATEIVLISDMIEECQNSIEGRDVNLAHPHIQGDLTRVTGLGSRQLANLRGARVTALIPTSDQPLKTARVNRPPVNELRQYWHTLLDHCNQDSAIFSLGADLPKRLKDRIPEERNQAASASP
jgi:hypothetical protein